MYLLTVGGNTRENDLINLLDIIKSRDGSVR